MNKKILIISFFVAIITHYYIIGFNVDEKSAPKQTPINKNPNISLHMITIKPTQTFENKKAKSIKQEVTKESVKPKVIQQKINENKKVANTKEDKKQNLQIAKQNLQKFKETYLSKLRIKISENQQYPNISKRLKEEGIVSLSFRVLKNGIFENIRVSKSSGKERLDLAALNTIKLTNKFKPFDKTIKKEFIDLTLAIQFKL